VIRALREDDLGTASELLAERHARQCAAEPLLPEAPDFRAEVEALWVQGVGGAFAADGYLVARTRDDPRWGPNVWIEAAGHAARDPELVRDLYAEAARGWVERGLRAHYVLVPATDAGLVDAWFRLGFGAQQAHGVVEIPEVGWPTEARLATLDDLEQMVALAPLLDEHSRASPVFATPSAYSEDDLRAEIAGDLANEDYGNIVAERDGRLVGDFFVCPIELSDAHAGLARPPGAAILGFAVIRPDLRGTGIGLALTQACFAWARERGYRTMVTDWRVTNLSASRFWPRRGFRTTFLRLHRHVA